MSFRGPKQSQGCSVRDCHTRASFAMTNEATKKVLTVW
jgi:hypothetical protein